VPPDEPEQDERCRRIERGARLVVVMPTSYSVVLQMPRGNLETIYPRALVLDGIRRAINDNDYYAAFMACRNHRVDMNILHDHAPKKFFENIPLFVAQIKSLAHLDLFLSQLRYVISALSKSTWLIYIQRRRCNKDYVSQAKPRSCR
jgi:elongator complex protein 1